MIVVFTIKARQFDLQKTSLNEVERKKLVLYFLFFLKKNNQVLGNLFIILRGLFIPQTPHSHIS